MARYFLLNIILLFLTVHARVYTDSIDDAEFFLDLFNNTRLISNGGRGLTTGLMYDIETMHCIGVG